jgi:hypothetical protein
MAGAAPGSGPYTYIVFTGPAAQAFAAATAPLISNFGENLTLWRDGNLVHWSYEGQSIVVEMQFDGTLAATFIDRPGTDAITGDRVSAVYRRIGDRPYRLTPGGATAMVGDMMAFFSGDREPLFAFTGLQ